MSMTHGVIAFEIHAISAGINNAGKGGMANEGPMSQTTVVVGGGISGITAAVEAAEIGCDVLIVGGGMSGCCGAYEAAFWAKEHGLRAVVVEKAAMERSGAVA